MTGDRAVAVLLLDGALPESIRRDLAAALAADVRRAVDRDRARRWIRRLPGPWRAGYRVEPRPWWTQLADNDHE